MTVVIGACMFTLGVFVGRGTAPVRFDMEKLQKELTALRKTEIQKEQLQEKIHTEAIDSKTDLNFYEALKTPGKGHGNKDDLEIKAPKPDVTKRPASQEKSTAGAADGSARKNTESRAVYFIQVASLKESTAADTVVARLKKKGYIAQQEMKNVPNKGIWFRVRIGTFSTKADADTMLERLKKDKFGGMVMKR